MLTRDVVKNSNVTGKPYEYVKQILDFLVNTNIYPLKGNFTSPTVTFLDINFFA